VVTADADRQDHDNADALLVDIALRCLDYAEVDQDLIDQMGEERLRQLGAAMKVAAYHGRLQPSNADEARVIAQSYI
jgi:hypothetical protein